MSTADATARPATDRHLVIVNQSTNYLTVGFANAFNAVFGKVTLVAGNVHEHGEQLNDDIEVVDIARWEQASAYKKLGAYGRALGATWWLLMTRFPQAEVLFVGTPPMAYLLGLVLPHRSSMVVWDVYPDTLKIAGMPEDHPVYRLWSRLNRRAFQRAHRVFTISEPMADMLSRYVERSRLIVHPIWSIFQQNERVPRDANPFAEAHDLGDAFVVQYSGNIGATHNVEVLVDVADRLREEEHVRFQIIGRGPRLEKIKALVAERGLTNVELLPFQSDEMFKYSLSAADLGVVILHEAVSRGSMPSKAFNLMSFGIPGLYVSAPDSELARTARQYGHAGCFESCDLDGMVAFIKALAADRARHDAMAERAELASSDYRRGNADRYVESYLAGDAPAEDWAGG